MTFISCQVRPPSPTNGLQKAFHIGYLIPWCYFPSPKTVAVVAKPSPSFAKDPILIAIGDAIRRTRATRNISQEALADLAGIDRSYMGGIERGEHNVAVINLSKIADALEVRPSTLLATAGI
ncbi:helix-turn-helix domain-containing protein [Acidovorax sp. NPDC077664]|uniref:helix-turn-helix domain-containing protein n=1 Tax=Acidovorax sp. NPDC077664 TaxID=3390544 RepID=UPI003CFD11E0